MIEAGFTSVLQAGLTGLVLSYGIEQLLTPKPKGRRSGFAWALHVGLCLIAHAILTLLLARPWFSAAIVSAFLLMVALVNNAKFRALREPFVFQDYEYFTDAVRFPRLYIPFMGWWKFIGAAAGFIMAVAIGWFGEPPPLNRFALKGQLGAVMLSLLLGGGLLWWGSLKKLSITYQPEHDLHQLGLLASLWRYAQEGRKKLQINSPFDSPPKLEPTSALPTLVAVQSESFFDARTLFDGIRPEILSEFDRLRQDAEMHGKLQVPAWGANTVRSEFAFLSGVAADDLAIHRFNPYRAIAAGSWQSSLASYLKQLGYRTVCIHPYPASFYLRDKVYPRLGFDEFIDIRSFDNTQKYGPYIADAAVANKVDELIRQASAPLFIFVITMENHGPLHLEKITAEDLTDLYSKVPPKNCDDLAVYLRHLRNANGMITSLRQTLERCEEPASLCWYGDHVPIMPFVYQTFGTPEGEVEYVLWTNRSANQPEERALNAHDLASTWLHSNGLM